VTIERSSNKYMVKDVQNIMYFKGLQLTNILTYKDRCMCSKSVVFKVNSFVVILNSNFEVNIVATKETSTFASYENCVNNVKLLVIASIVSSTILVHIVVACFICSDFQNLNS